MREALIWSKKKNKSRWNQDL